MRKDRIRQLLAYKPYWGYVLNDILLLVVSFFVVLMWFPLNTRIPFQKYDTFAFVFAGVWLVVNYFAHCYVRVKFMKVGVAISRLLAASAMVFGLMYIYMEWMSQGMNYSINVLLTIWLAMVLCCVLTLLLHHAYRYAINAEPEIERAPERGPQAVLAPPKEYGEEEIERRRQNIAEYTSQNVLNYLDAHVQVVSSNTYVTSTSELFNIQKLRYYRYDTIINFMPLNQIRGINKMFGTINDKLPDDGLYVCCFESQTVTKRKILNKYPIGINWIVYTALFLYRRVMPKVLMTSRLYYDITEGKDRQLSKAEVLGRLCYCGFAIVDEHKIGNLTYVVARRQFRPQTVQRRLYGIFIKLNRVGKDGRVFKVYKFRTMHPYSEYLQQYVYEHYSLQEGGKFNHDIRVSTLGRFFRKCWLDELPMLLNLIKGDLKLVGVRPLSKQYYSLYTPELQEKRTHHKPGMLPPFYADMPKTLDDIQASEMRYLIACEEKGTFKTDWKYFWRIVYTIIFKHARSN